MKILFIHQCFPGQFKFLAPQLAADSGNTVVAMTMQQLDIDIWQGVRLVPYTAGRLCTPNIHPWISDFESMTICGEAAFLKALELRNEGFFPDIIIAHPGWGESLFIKEVWPDARLGIYCEFFYRANSADVGFDPEFSSTGPLEACRIKLKNINNFLHFETADLGLSPTEWQAGTFPEPFRNRITVAHEGIDTAALRPDETSWLIINNNLHLTQCTENITFVNRNLEPYRGYHIFMRALPEILKRRPSAKVLIVGGDEVSYGAAPPEGHTWKSIFALEVKPLISDEDWSRVHFLGKLSYEHFILLLQISTVHVYLTYPFVLSWSLLEAMSCGCAIVASNTEPVHEAIKHDETGRLVDFFDVKQLTEEICTLLDDPALRRRLGNNAREFAVSNYDLNTICLPRQLEWVRTLAG